MFRKEIKMASVKAENINEVTVLVEVKGSGTVFLKVEPQDSEFDVKRKALEDEAVNSLISGRSLVSSEYDEDDESLLIVCG